MAFTSITVTGTYLQNDGTAAAGTVSFVLSATLLDSSSDRIHSPVLTTATLNGSGAFSITLVANDDTTTTPTGSSYKVTEQITGAAPRSYNVIIPHTAAGGTVDISTLAPATTTAYLSYALTSNNLSDLTSAATARKNLGLGDTAGHLTLSGSAPSIAAGAGAGTTPTVSISGIDSIGTITITTGTSPTASATVATITFATAFAATPKGVLLIPCGVNSAALGGTAAIYEDQASRLAASFVLKSGALALDPSTTYLYSYLVIG